MEMENLLKKGRINEFLLHLEWREDTLIVIRYPCSANPGMSPKVTIFFSNINLLLFFYLATNKSLYCE